MHSYFARSRLLYSPPNPAATRVEVLRRMINHKHGLNLKDYHDLYIYSVSEWAFWHDLWEFLNIKSSCRPSAVISPGSTPYTPTFFPDALLNYAENLLGHSIHSDAIAITISDESLHSSDYTWRQVNELVRQTSRAMRAIGIRKGDRIAAIVRNSLNAVVVALATASIGAVFSSTSTDMGTQGILNRYLQIRPSLIFAEVRVLYAGHVVDITEKVTQVVKVLKKASGLQQVVTLPPTDAAGTSAAVVPDSITFETLLAMDDGKPIEFEQLPFSHPLYILFSSGTSGPPKCIVHCAGGVLLQAQKEFMMMCGLNGDDTYFQYTTTGWVMWPYMITGLATGARIVLYDGSPFYPTLQQNFKFISDQRVSLFGTSPRFLAEVKGKGIEPLSIAPFHSLRCIGVTGAIFTAAMFEWTHKAFGGGRCLQIFSGTGGTDICAGFATGVESLPVFAGEIQAKALGMKVEVFSPSGSNIEHTGEAGELVCTRPHPSLPICLWGDTDGSLLRKTYFDMYPGVWRQGDFIVVNPKTKGIAMLGRSDGVLNPSGVRFGSGEIYAVLEEFSALVDDALCVGQRRAQDEDERVLLFLKMRAGCEAAFDAALVRRVKEAIRRALSARHVPAYVFRVDDIPYTGNGKKIEIAVKKIVSGTDFQPSGMVANPESLLLYHRYRDLERLFGVMAKL